VKFDQKVKGVITEIKNDLAIDGILCTASHKKLYNSLQKKWHYAVVIETCPRANLETCG
jgi:hypothetical protein